LEISRACDDDFSEILALQKLAFQENALRYDDPNIPPLTETLEQFREDCEGQTVLKMVENEKIIGSVRGRLNGNVCRVGRVIVHPDHWNKGIAHKMIATIESEFDASVYELVTGVEDHKNISLYRKHGYEIVEGELYKITHNLYFVRMVKMNGPARPSE
jgi:GNAT superfamily N-acetyltransferase